MPRDGFLSRLTNDNTGTTTVRMSNSARQAFKSYAADHNMPMTRAIDEAARVLREHSNMGQLHDRLAKSALTINDLQKELQSSQNQLRECRAAYADTQDTLDDVRAELHDAKWDLSYYRAPWYSKLWRKIVGK